MTNAGKVSRYGNVVPFARRAEDRPIPPPDVFVGLRNAVVGTALIALVALVFWAAIA